MSGVRDIDLGLRRFVAKLRDMQAVHVTVGVHAEQAAQQHQFDKEFSFWMNPAWPSCPAGVRRVSRVARSRAAASCS